MRLFFLFNLFFFEDIKNQNAQKSTVNGGVYRARSNCTAACAAPKLVIKIARHCSKRKAGQAQFIFKDEFHIG